MSQCRAQNGDLKSLQLGQIVRLQAPLDFGISRERAGTGARDVGEDSIEKRSGWKRTRIGDEDGYILGAFLSRSVVLWTQHCLQQTSAVGMEFYSGNAGIGIAVCYGPGLATGSGAAIKDLRSVANEGGNQLRSLVLNDDAACAECLRLGDVSALNASRRNE